jgi:hypothetical protein
MSSRVMDSLLCTPGWNAPVVDPSLATPARNFGASGRARTIVSLEWASDESLVGPLFDRVRRLVQESRPAGITLIGSFEGRSAIHQWRTTLGIPVEIVQPCHVTGAWAPGDARQDGARRHGCRLDDPSEVEQRPPHATACRSQLPVFSRRDATIWQAHDE